MNEISQLIKTLKRRLKIQGMTYRELAAALNLSEASVKRLFASERFTLERIVEVANLLGFTLAELTAEASVSENRLHTLSEEQEKELVSDIKLLLVAVCVLNQWPVDAIVEAFQISRPECILRLVKLDRLRLITLLPGERVRLNIARDFDWLPRGPIREFFQGQGMADFLNSDFAQPGEVLAFSHAMLTDAAIERVQVELRKLRQKFAELHEECLAAPLAKRRGTGLLLATREWEIGAFVALRRPVGERLPPVRTVRGYSSSRRK